LRIRATQFIQIFFMQFDLRKNAISGTQDKKQVFLKYLFLDININQDPR